MTGACIMPRGDECHQEYLNRVADDHEWQRMQRDWQNDGPSFIDFSNGETPPFMFAHWDACAEAGIPGFGGSRRTWTDESYCHPCKGTGRDGNGTVCEACHGTGVPDCGRGEANANR